MIPPHVRRTPWGLRSAPPLRGTRITFRSTLDPSVTIGFLHVGAPEHGVTRYGRILATAARAHLDDRVVEASVELVGPPVQHRGALVEASTVLSGADAVHLQYNARIWGEPERALENLQTFAEACPAPLVVTMHDLRDGYGWGGIARRLWMQRSARASGAASDSGEAPANRPSAASRWWRSGAKAVRFLRHERANANASKWIARHAAHVVVCTREEARRARSLSPRRLTVIPHFVEERPRDARRDAAKAALDLTGRRVLGVLGYIHRRKGHDLVVEALADLPDDVVAAFIGRPGRDSPGFARELRERVEALGVADRMRITGFVEEDVLNQYLTATDLALCPFRRASASGSLSTWIAAERPILAADLPLIDDYDALVPGAIATFSPYTPPALAEAVRGELARDAADVTPDLRRLREQLALPTVIRQHRDVWTRAA